MAKREGARGGSNRAVRGANQRQRGRSGKRPTGKRQLSRPAAKARKRPKASKAGAAQAGGGETAGSAAPSAARSRGRPRQQSGPPRPRPPDARRDRADAALVAGHGPSRVGRPDRPRRDGAETLREHAGMTPDITAGDVDVDVEDAYFTRRGSARRRQLRRPIRTSSTTSARRWASNTRTTRSSKAATRSSSATSTGGSWIRLRRRTTRRERSRDWGWRAEVEDYQVRNS